MEGSKLPTRTLKLPFVIDKATARPRFFMRANYDGQIMPTAPVDDVQKRNVRDTIRTMQGKSSKD
jgi:hypothetical protein